MQSNIIFHTIRLIVLWNQIQSFITIQKLKQNYLVVEPIQRRLLQTFLVKKSLQIVINNVKQHDASLFFGLQTEA